MKTVGIICEYNPFHLGHLQHIEQTKRKLAEDAAIVCVMSGNFVQRGDFAILNKHARAKMAVMCGADVVIELPTPYVLSSAREFARAGVYLLDAIGVCDYISFGSESGRLRHLIRAARVIASSGAEKLIKTGLDSGLPYAAAQQKAADELLGDLSSVFSEPNNTLAVEYIKALNEIESHIQPITIKRIGGRHDGDTGYSAAAVRSKFSEGTVPMAQMPGAAVAVCMEELIAGRAPVLMSNFEQAILSRLRTIADFTDVSGATDGLDGRFKNTAPNAPSVGVLLNGIKTKRFAMSRIRRVMMCAVLGINGDDIKNPPPYIRVLAMNRRGMSILKTAADNCEIPIIVKPASINRLDARANYMFNLESKATDFYTLAYENENDRRGGNEWRTSPIIIED